MVRHLVMRRKKDPPGTSTAARATSSITSLASESCPAHRTRIDSFRLFGTRQDSQGSYIYARPFMLGIRASRLFPRRQLCRRNIVKKELVPITAKDANFQHIETLRRNRKKRSKEGVFVVDSVRAINLLVGNDQWEVDAFVYPRTRTLSDWARALIDGDRARVYYEVDDDLFHELCEREESQEIIALAKIPEDSDARISIREDKKPLILFMDRPNLPGNLGTLIRSCDAFGVDGVVVFGHAADLYEPQTVRASLGTLFALPVIRMFTWEEVDHLLERVRAVHPDAQVIGSSAQAHAHPEDLALTRATFLIVGNETKGMCQGFADRVDESACIPMQGAASSMNMACAATTLLYEVSRQRRVR